jgi:hypothetical protein
MAFTGTGVINADPELQLRRPELVELLEYWKRKRDTRPFPSRKDIAPREMLEILPWLHLYDVRGNGEEYLCRLGGTALGDLIGQSDCSGQPISILPQPVFVRLKQALDWVVRTRAPLRTYNPSTSIPGQEFQGSESFFAPLSNDGDVIDVIIGATMLEKRK